MERRRYRLGKRAEAAEDTRRRIVEAAYALHAEQGIVATTMKQIAERAGVAVGTVYHHFPEYADAIAACGAYTSERTPMPTAADFAGLASIEARLRALARAWFAHYAKLPGWARLYGEREAVPLLGHVIAEQQRRRMAQLAEALRPLKVPVELRRVAAALLDSGTWLSLRAAGFTPAKAADAVADLLAARLLPASSRGETP